MATEASVDDVDIAELRDDALIDAMVRARRRASQEQAAELAAVAELARRRRAEATSPAAVEALSPLDYLLDEVGAALSLTARAATDLIDFATALSQRLPATLEALATGEIDYRKARTIWHGVHLIDDTLAGRIEAAVLPRAGEQTTAQTQAKIRRLIKKLDPDAFERRRKKAQTQRRVELTSDDSGTAHLSGCDLDADAATTAYNRINAIAKARKSDGDIRTIDQLRADTYLAILHGRSNPSTPVPAAHHDWPEGRPQTEHGPPTPPEQREPTSIDRHGVAATGRHEPVTTAQHEAAATGWRAQAANECHQGAATERGEWTAIKRHEATSTERPGGAQTRRDEHRWTELDDLTAVAIAQTASEELNRLSAQSLQRHRNLADLLGQAGQRIRASLADLKTPWCTTTHPHTRTKQRPVTAYRPTVAIRRLIENRDGRCRFPGCRQSASNIDIDHTIPHHRCGPTCPCNLAALCRRHHKLKQTKGWKLIQIWPGVLLWITPTGHWHIITPIDRE